jgi:voltage-gated potassium channel
MSVCSIGTKCERLGDRYTVVFEVVEWVSVVAFTLEYIMRMWACIEDEENRKRGPFWGRVRHAFTFYPLVDVLSILPNWFSLVSYTVDPFLPGHQSFESPNFTTAGRIVRLVRIFKTDKYLNAFSLLGDVLWDNRILLTATSFYSMMVWVISATLLYYTERNNRSGEMGTHFQSIPLSMFPTLLMLTGEFPLSDFTPVGQVVSCFIAIIAVAIFAVPTSILGSGFMQAVQKSQHRQFTVDTD